MYSTLEPATHYPFYRRREIVPDRNMPKNKNNIIQLHDMVVLLKKIPIFSSATSDSKLLADETPKSQCFGHSTKII